MSTSKQPSIIKSLFFSFLALIVFYLLTQIIGIILILLYAFLRVIPLIGDLLGFFFEARGDGPEIAIPYLYLVTSYFLCISMLERIVKSVPTRKLTIKLLGIYLIVLNLLFLLLNILGDGAWGINIGCIIAGIAFIVKSGKYVSTPTPPRSSPTPDAKQEETVYYMEAANGMTVRVPESKLEVWQAEQDRIRNNPDTAKLTEKEQMLVDAIVRDIYGSKGE